MNSRNVILLSVLLLIILLVIYINRYEYEHVSAFYGNSYSNDDIKRLIDIELTKRLGDISKGDTKSQVEDLIHILSIRLKNYQNDSITTKSKHEVAVPIPVKVQLPIPPSTEDEPQLIEFPPEIKAIIMNIGCNIDPPMPPEDNSSIGVLAVEPILGTAARIVRHERLYVITCAIADTNRFQMMNLYNAGGLSSSLAKLSDESVWYKRYTDVDPRKGFSGRKNPDFKEAEKVHQPLRQIVPVFSLETLLNSIPKHIQILELHTDMQGFDLTAIKSAGLSIRRIPKLQTEVYMDTSAYQGVANDFEKDWKPYMEKVGYKAVNQAKANSEADVYWEIV